MSIELVYLAHPVGAADRAGVDANLARATRWYAWLLEVERDVAITAPWLGALLGRVQDDGNPAHRARGLRDNLAIARRCDGIVLCGGTISRGMQAELDAVAGEGGWVADLTAYGIEPPSGVVMGGVTIAHGRAEWQRVLRSRRWRRS